MQRASLGGVAVFAALLIALPAAAGDAIADLVQRLKHPNPGVRGDAAMKLGAMGPKAAAAVPALAEAVLDRDLNVRYWAATALKAMGPAAKEAVPALIKALDTFPGGSPALDGPNRYYADLRSVAAEALGAIGPSAAAAIPALEKATKDPDPSVCERARAALTQVRQK